MTMPGDAHYHYLEDDIIVGGKMPYVDGAIARARRPGPGRAARRREDGPLREILRREGRLLRPLPPGPAPARVVSDGGRDCRPVQGANRGVKAELIVDAKAEVGEGPVWVASQQRLYWVDIGAGPAARVRSERMPDEVARRRTPGRLCRALPRRPVAAGRQGRDRPPGPCQRQGDVVVDPEPDPWLTTAATTASAIRAAGSGSAR